jgi:coenzyme F420-reducing hydrogenase delta subunit
MNRSLAALAAAAMFAASVPTIGFADESSSSSSASTVESSVSSSSMSASSESTSSESSTSNSSKGKKSKLCDDMTGLKRAQCQAKARIEKKQAKDRVQRRTEDKALRINGDCSSLEGAERLKCVRKNGKRGIKSFIMKKSKFDQEHTIRGEKVEDSSSSESDEESED